MKKCLAVCRIFPSWPVYFGCIDQPSTSTSYAAQPIFLKRKYCSKPTNLDKAPCVKPGDEKLVVKFEHGLPNLVVPLPSRKEYCQFTLRPISDDVGTLCDNLIKEDNGIEIVAFYNSDGTRISKSTNIQHLLRFGEFRLRINDTYFDVSLPAQLHEVGHECLESGEALTTLDDLKSKVSSLYAILNVDDYKLQREKLLLNKLEEVEIELRPMEIIRKKIDEECQLYSQKILWIGFIALGFQTGVFARLTWWEYSWDIVEPVTYFATFSTVFATVGYYLLTNQNFEYSSAHKRVFTNEFHRRAVKYKFDIQKYNTLSELGAELRHDLKRLRDPLYQHLPVNRLSSLESEKAKVWVAPDVPPHTLQPIKCLSHQIAKSQADETFKNVNFQNINDGISARCFILCTSLVGSNRSLNIS
uniref:Calcium uniporter protein n=1 Tax=Ditylenchus dipsaci TaxID=166011 RepID=A0A915EB80_9BILA